MHFDWYGTRGITPDFVAHWRALGLAASTPNIYLMPDFMIAAIRYLEEDKEPQIAALWNVDRSALLALGVFNSVPPSWRFPYPRLSAVKTKHSFQSGVLLRAGVEAQVVDRFVCELFESGCRAVRLNELRADSLVYRQLQDAAKRNGIRWFVDARYDRAAVKLAGDPRWRAHVSRSRHRRLQKARAKLAELGHVEFRVVQGSAVSETTVDAFLRVEAMGWKRDSSLLATDSGTGFFRDVTRACCEHGMMFFCELVLDGEVIASTSNFNVGGHGFAFKVGNNPEYARLSPGYLVEYAFLESAAGTCPHLLEIESGSQAGSFIEVLWPERIPMESGHLVSGTLPAAYARLKQRIKSARRTIAANAGAA